MKPGSCRKMDKKNSYIALVIGIAFCSFILYSFTVKKELPIKAALTPASFSLPLSHEFPKYPFINFDLNKIDYYGDSTQFTRFYRKLDSLIFSGKGKINVMHMGGSHVQAGTLSNRMRENLFSLSEGMKGERGFYFPFRLAHTNGPRNFKVEYSGDWEGCRNAHKKQHCDWGVSGYNASTSDTLTHIKTWSFDKDSVIYPFSSCRIYHHLRENCYEISPDTSMALLETIRDSSAGFTQFVFAQPYDTLSLHVEKTDSLQNYFAIQGIKLENENPGLSYHSIGVNGASVPSYLRCNNFVEQLKTFPPDLVIFGIGINDAYMPSSSFKQREFEANYDTLITWIRNANPETSFLFLTNNDSYYRRKYANKNALKVKEAMLNLAERHDAAVWDLFEIMGGLNSVKSWQKAGLAKKDKIHFTPQGYILQADMMFEALKNGYGNYLEEEYSLFPKKNQNPQN